MSKSRKNDDGWRENYEKLKRYKATHGNLGVVLSGDRVSKSGDETVDERLLQWMELQRKHYQAGDLRDDRKQLLDWIGFLWKEEEEEKETAVAKEVVGDEAAWNVNFQKLLKYKETTGHARIPKSDTKLWEWAKLQRQRCRAGTLRQDFLAKLRAIGFVFYKKTQTASPKWMASFEKLCAFYQQHGHTMVPCHYAADPKLGNWVTNQRSNQKMEKLELGRKRLLDEIGFVWDVHVEKRKKGSLPISLGRKKKRRKTTTTTTTSTNTTNRCTQQQLPTTKPPEIVQTTTVEKEFIQKWLLKQHEFTTAHALVVASSTASTCWTSSSSTTSSSATSSSNSNSPAPPETTMSHNNDHDDDVLVDGERDGPSENENGRGSFDERDKGKTKQQEATRTRKNDGANDDDAGQKQKKISQLFVPPHPSEKEQQRNKLEEKKRTLLHSYLI